MKRPRRSPLSKVDPAAMVEVYVEIALTDVAEGFLAEGDKWTTAEIQSALRLAEPKLRAYYREQVEAMIAGPVTVH